MKATEWLTSGEDSPKGDDEPQVTVRTGIPSDPSFVDSRELLQHLEDIKAAMGTVKTATEREIVISSRRPQSAVLSYGASQLLAGRSGPFRPPLHDYGEIARAVDTESFLARSIQKHREYILKEGWKVTGSNPETLDYVRQRLFLLGLSTGITPSEWIRELVTNLVTYSTALIVFKRDKTKSIGRSIRLHGKKLEPIAGVFPMDSVSVKVKQNLSGRPIQWRQEIDGKTRTFHADDVMHITIDRKSGFVFGTPYSVTVLDDIRALRRLEELVEMVAHKHLFPLFHVKIGTENAPAQDIETPAGTLVSEVDVARNQIEDMPCEGGLVTSERYDIELLGAEGKVLDLTPYIEHFKERVMSGLRLSPLDLGQADSGNKATAQVVNRNLVDAVKDFQRVISDQVTFQLLDTLLLEGGFDLTEENRVVFTFPSVDREEERAQQAHALTLFQTNAITSEELRRDYMHREGFTSGQESDTFFERYKRPELDMQITLAEASLQHSTSGSSSSATTKGDSKTERVNTVKARPTNQFGTSPTKPTFPANDVIEKVIREWNVAASEVIDNIPYEDVIRYWAAKSKSLVRMEMLKEFKKGVEEVNALNKDTVNVPISVAQVYIDKTMPDALQKSVKSTIIMDRNLDKDPTLVRSSFDVAAITLYQTLDKLLRSAKYFGFIKAARETGDCMINGHDEIGTLTEQVNIAAPNIMARLVNCYSINIAEVRPHNDT